MRNISTQPTFFHNGAFTKLRAAIRHHLNSYESPRNYDPEAEGVAKDLNRPGPIEPLLARIDPILATTIELTKDELRKRLRYDARPHSMALHESY